MEETCIVIHNEDEEKDNNDLDNYYEKDTVFCHSKKNYDLDTFFTEPINYNISSGTTEDIINDENIKQKKYLHH